MPFPYREAHDRARAAYRERLRARGLTERGKPFRRHWVSNPLHAFESLIPVGPARDMIAEWQDMGIPVSFYLQMQGEEKDAPPGVWMIRVGDRELSVEEYLLLFDEEDK